jgi:polyisoprenoid-binding protein YceI
MSERVTTTPGVRVVNGRSVPEPSVYTIDPSHASFEFVARHLMAKVRGRFSGVRGKAHIAEVPGDSTLEVVIDVSTVDTKDPNRDAHLLSGEFFDVEHYPTIHFRSTEVRAGVGETEWKVDGNLTIRGITRSVTVDVQFLGAGTDPWGNRRIGFSGVVPEVDREGWGLTWNAPLESGGLLLAKSVRLEIEVELIKK